MGMREDKGNEEEYKRRRQMGKEEENGTEEWNRRREEYSIRYNIGYNKI